jgi:hypothetical protein
MVFFRPSSVIAAQPDLGELGFGFSAAAPLGVFSLGVLFSDILLGVFSDTSVWESGRVLVSFSLATAAPIDLDTRRLTRRVVSLRGVASSGASATHSGDVLRSSSAGKVFARPGTADMRLPMVRPPAAGTADTRRARGSGRPPVAARRSHQLPASKGCSYTQNTWHPAPAPPVQLIVTPACNLNVTLNTQTSSTYW